MTEVDVRQQQQPDRPARVKVDLTKPLEDLDQAFRVASALAMSDLVPVPLRDNPNNVLLVMLTGMELGLTITQAVRSVFIPANGLPGLRGEMMLAKLREAGHDYEFTETEDSCTFKLIRKDGREYVTRFTVDDALAARLVSRDKNGDIVALSRDGRPLPWMLYRPDLLFWRAATRGVKRGAPEVLYGLEVAEAYDPEPVQAVLPDIRPEGGNGKPAEPPVDPKIVRAEVLNLEAEMTPAAGADTTATPAEPAGADSPVEVDLFEVPLPATEAAAKAGAGTRKARRTHPSAAGDVPSRGAQPPPPQGRSLEDEVQEAFALRGVAEQTDLAGPLKHLAGKFTTLGWNPDQYGANVLMAASAFVRRRVTSLSELDPTSVAALSAALSQLITKHKAEPDMYPVVLADAVEGWRADWEHDEPDAYYGSGYE